MKRKAIYFLVLTAVLLTGCPMAKESQVSTSNANRSETPTNTSTTTNTNGNTYDLPQFPFPPNASASREIDSAWLKNPNAPTTFGEVNDKLRSALQANGYQSLRYYSVQSTNGGFVITTAIEQFLANGKPIPGANRFTTNASAPSVFSTDYWANILSGNNGRYRLIALMVTDKLYADSGNAPTLEAAQGLAGGGLNQLPPEMRSLPFTDRHSCTALVYEFRKDRSGGQVNFVKNSDVSAEAHLQNLLKTLRGGR